MKYVIGMGEALWDCLPEGRKIGGAPANFAYHAAQFGLQSVAVSAVGHDALGQEILDTFSQKGLSYYLPQVSFPTGTVQVTLDDQGVPQYDICENVAWDNIPYTDELDALARQTRAVCFGSLAQRNEVSRKTIRRFLTTMPQTGDTLRVFDINLRQHFYSKDILEESFRLCNVLKINDEELVIVQRMFGYEGLHEEDTCKKLISDFGLKLLILTCGTNGSYVFDKDAVSFMPTPKVKVADTVGAGDSFTGSFVAQLLLGKTVREAHETAVRVSAFVCTQNGAMPQLPEEVKNGK